MSDIHQYGPIADQSDAVQLVKEKEIVQIHPIRDNVIRHVSKREATASFRKIPEHCVAQGYCTDIYHYPFESVDKLLNQLTEEDFERFQVDTSDLPKEDNISNSTMHLCPTKMEFLNVTAAQDIYGTWHTVINRRDKPLQSFRSILCRDIPCNCSEHVRIEKGYSASCVQKFACRIMETITAENNILSIPLFIPSCCACVVSLKL